MMHSTLWLPRLGVHEFASVRGPMSSARGLPPTWDMLGGEGRAGGDVSPMAGAGSRVWGATSMCKVQGRWGPVTRRGGSSGLLEVSGFLPNIPACPAASPAPLG